MGALGSIIAAANAIGRVESNHKNNSHMINHHRPHTTEQKENTKLDSFRYRVTQQQAYFSKFLWADLEVDRFVYCAFTPAWLRQSKNDYNQVIVNELGPLTSEYNDCLYGIPQPKTLNDLLQGISTRVYAKVMSCQPYGKDGNGSYRRCYAYSSRKNKERWIYEMIFWWLVALALDEELYESQLDYVVDAADVFGFTEEMMDDFCEAAMYFLNGNDIRKDCDLQVQTAEAKKFFLGEEA